MPDVRLSVSRLRRLLRRVLDTGWRPQDDDETCIRKILLNLTSVLFASAAMLWLAVGLVVDGRPAVLAAGAIPVLVLARLAVDRRAQGMQLGGALLQDALNRALVVSQNTGVRALLVHALHERARLFYAHYGFQPSPLDAMTLMLRLKS